MRRSALYRITGWLSAFVLVASLVLIGLWLRALKPEPEGCRWLPVEALGNRVETLYCPEGRP